MASNEKVRNLDLRSTRVYTLSDKVKEKPVILLTNTDLAINKKGNARGIQLGRCYDFLGTNEYIEFGNHDDFSFAVANTDEPFSISAWIYMDDASDFNILNKYGASGTEWYFTSNYADTLYFQLRDASELSTIYKTVASMNSYEGEWIHVCGTYDGSSVHTGLNIYINGISSGTSGGAGGSYNSMEPSSETVQIGLSYSTYSDGKMFDVRIHKAELTQSEIWNVMKGASSKHEVGWWKCDVGAGGVAYDSSGRGHHGLIKNATLSTFHVTDSSLPYSFQNNVGFNIAKLYNSSTTTSTTSTSTTTTSTSSTSTSSSTTSSSTTSSSTSTTSTSSSTSTSTSTTSSSTTSTTIT